MRAAASVLLAVVAASACKNTPRRDASVAPADSNAPSRPIVVATAAELIGALKSARPGSTVLLQPGTYEIANTLVVPDGVTVLGSGAMHLDARGRLPTGFDPPTRTVLKSAAGLTGDVMLLGNRSVARGLAIEDAAGRSSGYVVGVHSRGAGDVVSATLEDCEILNPNNDGVARERPIGGAVAAVTGAPTNPASADSSTKWGASVALRMSHCIVNSPAGIGVFATNFAPRGRVNILLTENIIGGGLTASGGASGAYAMSGASTGVESRGNVFRADSATRPTTAGWLLSAVSTPDDSSAPARASTKDTLRVRSIGDRIEGFQTAILASGALRLRSDAEALSENVVTLELQQTELRSTKVDLDLAGARSLSAGAFPDSGNALRLTASGMAGSGVRGNSYAATFGPPGTSWLAGNRVEVIGSPGAFASANPRIAPPPARVFFNATPTTALDPIRR